MTKKEMKDWIDGATYEDMLTRWRWAPSGSPWFQGEIGKYFELIMSQKRKEIGPTEATRISKRVGWEKDLRI